MINSTGVPARYSFVKKLRRQVCERTHAYLGRISSTIAANRIAGLFICGHSFYEDHLFGAGQLSVDIETVEVAASGQLSGVDGDLAVSGAAEHDRFDDLTAGIGDLHLRAGVRRWDVIVDQGAGIERVRGVLQQVGR